MRLPEYEHKFWLWLTNWLDLIDSIVYICTFTLYSPYWGMPFRCWSTKRMLNKRIKARAERLV